MTTPFKTIRARAEKRKGGPKALGKLLPPTPDRKALAKLRDDRILSEMSKRVFCAGFAWSVIENKWSGFEKAFLGFTPAKLVFQPGDFWDALLSDTRIVRNGAEPVRETIGAGENAEYARHCLGAPRFDAPDAGVRMRRAHHHRIGLSFDVEIIAEPSAASRQPRVLLASERLTDVAKTCRWETRPLRDIGHRANGPAWFAFAEARSRFSGRNAICLDKRPLRAIADFTRPG